MGHEALFIKDIQVNNHPILRRCATVTTALLFLILITGCGSGEAHPQKHAGTRASAESSNAQLPARSDLLAVGDVAPDFTAMDNNGKPVKLKDLRARGPVVMIFYPKDDSPTCTEQLCAVRDDWSDFEQRGASVLGVNPGDQASHTAFAEKFSYPFPLLVDQDSRIASAYGARGAIMPKRTVYVIDPDGKVLLAERGVVPHDRIFAALDKAKP